MIIDNTPVCPRCGKKPALHHVKYGVLPCEDCTQEDRSVKHGQPSEFATQGQLDRVKGERDLHSADILQPWTVGNKPNEEFIRAYPDKVDDYFDKDKLKGL